MARSSLVSGSIELHSQARNSVQYIILKHDGNEFNEIPLNPNLLTFNAQKIHSKFLHTLYSNPNSSEISKEFSDNLIKFYLYLLLTSTIILFSVGKLYSESNLYYNTLWFHIICIFSIQKFGLIILFLVTKKRYFLLNSPQLFCIIGCIWFIYLIISNEYVLYKLLGEKISSAKINFPVILISFIYYYRLIQFDSFRHVIFPIVIVLILSITINLALSPNYSTEIISEYSLIAIYLILQAIESQSISFRTSQLYYRVYTEELNNIDIEEDEELYQEHNIELISSSELIVEKCDRVIKEIQLTRKKIMFNDLKIRLKQAIFSLKIIRKFLGHQERSEVIKFNNNSNIDSQDKEFISQNFLAATQLMPARSKWRKKTFEDMIETNSSYSKTISNESLKILDSLGHDWNFDMLELYSRTNRSI